MHVLESSRRGIDVHLVAAELLRERGPIGGGRENLERGVRGHGAHHQGEQREAAEYPGHVRTPRDAPYAASSKLVRAMRADAVDVLELELAIRVGIARVVPRVLHTQARELARAPVQHHGHATRVRGLQQWEGTGR